MPVIVTSPVGRCTLEITAKDARLPNSKNELEFQMQGVKYLFVVKPHSHASADWIRARKYAILDNLIQQETAFAKIVKEEMELDVANFKSVAGDGVMIKSNTFTARVFGKIAVELLLANDLLKAKPAASQITLHGRTMPNWAPIEQTALIPKIYLKS